MQRATSTVEKAFSRSVMRTRSPALEGHLALAVERDHAGLQRHGKGLDPPAWAPSARCRTSRSMPGAIGARSASRRVRRVAAELHREAAGLAPAQRVQQPADGRQPDRLRVGESQVDGGQALGLPQRARADVAVGRDDGIDERDVMALAFVDRDLQQLVGRQRLFGAQLARRVEADRHAR